MTQPGRTQRDGRKGMGSALYEFTSWLAPACLHVSLFKAPHAFISGLNTH